jgi:hypothetical protein
LSKNIACHYSRKLGYFLVKAMIHENVPARTTGALFQDVKNLRSDPEAVTLMADESGNEQQWVKLNLDCYDQFAIAI